MEGRYAMENEEISMQTKKELAAALKKAMEKKPLSKVTVSELVKDCNINRNTFYYHFSDIYDLLKWMFEQEAIEVVKKIDLLVDADEAIHFVADYVEENCHIINCTYDSLGREETKRFFYSDFIGVMQNAIESGMCQAEISVDNDFKNRLIAFYTGALAESMLDYVKNPEYCKENFLQDTLFICQNSIPYLLKKRAEMEMGN